MVIPDTRCCAGMAGERVEPKRGIERISASQQDLYLWKAEKAGPTIDRQQWMHGWLQESVKAPNGRTPMHQWTGRPIPP